MGDSTSKVKIKMKSRIVAYLLFLASMPAIATGVPKQESNLNPGLARENQDTVKALRADKKTVKTLQSTKTMAKLDGFLRRLQAQQAQRAATPSQAIAPPDLKEMAVAHPFLRFSKQRDVQVYVQLSDSELATIELLTVTGMRIELLNRHLSRVQGWIDFERLEQLENIPAVVRISAPEYARPRAGSVMTQGDAIIKAGQLRGMGIRGKGVRVGVISDGANNWRDARARGDLPASGISTYGSCAPRSANPAACASSRSCNEGTAMAEIIHDIAPDATLAVAAASTSLEFIQRVNDLTNRFKADIIVDDIGFFGEPYFEDGDVADAVAAVASKLLFVSAAGNSADSHYELQYKPGAGDLHDFGRAAGQVADTDHGVIVPAKTGLVVIMQWNDPFTASSNDYDLALWDNNGIVSSSQASQDGPGSSPIEGFCYYNSSNSDQVRWLQVKKFSGQDKRLELFFLGRGAHEYNHPNGSIFGHAGLPSVLTAGTINAGDQGHNTLAFYSSRGPARIDFPAYTNRKKPDVTGIDGVSVTGVGGFSSTFYGTSAAAPHVAGVAALLMSVSSQAGGANVARAIKQGAYDLGASGFDSAYGYGRLDAASARELLSSGAAVPPVLYLLLLD